MGAILPRIIRDTFSPCAQLSDGTVFANNVIYIGRIPATGVSAACNPQCHSIFVNVFELVGGHADVTQITMVFDESAERSFAISDGTLYSDNNVPIPVAVDSSSYISDGARHSLVIPVCLQECKFVVITWEDSGTLQNQSPCCHAAAPREMQIALTRPSP